MSEDLAKRLAYARKTFCDASPGSDDEFSSLLLGFDTAVQIISEAEATQATDRKSHEKEVAVWSENYAALERERDALRRAVESHLTWFEKFICDSDELVCSTPRKIAENARDAASELRAILAAREATP